MADPTRYHPHFNYSGWEAAGPKRPKPGAELDIDFANIARSVDETIDALKDLRRSDGKLKNGIVDKDALDESSRELWESAEVAAEDAKGSAQSAAGAAASASTSAELARGYANDAVSQGNVPIYASAATVQGLEIPAGITAFRTNGETMPGDGKGSLYVESDATSGTLQSGDGRWWVEAAVRDHGTFSTVADVQNSHIPSVLESIRTFGRNAPGDGPPLDLVRGSEIPGAVQSADGQWWEDVGYNTITVRIPSQFPTLQAAVDHYSRLPMRQGESIELLIESGHQPASGVHVSDGDYSKFIVRSEDAEVLVDPLFSRSEAFISADNAAAPTLDCLVNANTRMSNGYHLINASRGCVTPGSGIKYVWGTGLSVNSGSSCKARDTIWTYCAQNGNTGSGVLVNGATADVDGADASGSLYYGIQSAYGAVTNARYSKANNTGRYGYRCRNSSNLDCESGEANNCAVNAIRAFHNGQVSARYFVGQGAGEDGAFITSCSAAQLQDADFSGAARYGVVSSGGSRTDARGCNAQVGGSPSTDDFRVDSGGTIAVNGQSIGGFSQEPNRMTGAGIINSSAAEAWDESFQFVGNWTPVLTCDSPGDLSVSYTDAVGRYVVTGRMVTVTFTLVASISFSTASGPIRVEGLPFPSVDLFRTSWHGSMVITNIDRPGYTNFALEMDQNYTHLNVRASGSGVGRALIDMTDASPGTMRIQGSITYWRS